MYQNITMQMNKRKPKKDKPSKGLLSSTKQRVNEEEMSITDPSRRVMEYVDIIRQQREEVKSNGSTPS